MLYPFSSDCDYRGSHVTVRSFPRGTLMFSSIERVSSALRDIDLHNISAISDKTSGLPCHFYSINEIIVVGKMLERCGTVDLIELSRDVVSN